MGLIGWLVAIGSLLVGAAVGLWGLTEVSKTIAIWFVGVPGGILLVVAAGFELQKLASETSGPSVGEMAARAYVFVEDVETTNIDDDVMTIGPRKIPSIKIVIRNSGQTPATGVVHQAAARVAAFPPPADLFQLPKLRPQSVFNLGAGGQALLELGAGPPLNDSQKPLLGMGLLAVYLFGEISYDTLGVRRCTHYRFMVGGDIGFNERRMSQMADGNEIDKNCTQL